MLCAGSFYEVPDEQRPWWAHHLRDLHDETQDRPVVLHDAESTGPGERSGRAVRRAVRRSPRPPACTRTTGSPTPSTVYSRSTPPTSASSMAHGKAESGSEGSTEHPNRSTPLKSHEESTAELPVADAAQVSCVDGDGSLWTSSAVTSTVLSEARGRTDHGPRTAHAQRLERPRRESHDAQGSESNSRPDHRG